jgi:hypothetical protein
VLTGLVMAAEANTTLRHSMTEIAGGYCELAILLLLVCRMSGKDKDRRFSDGHVPLYRKEASTLPQSGLSSDHFGTSALCKQVATKMEIIDISEDP